MILAYLASLSLLSASLASSHVSRQENLHRRGPNNPDPTVAMSSDDGWESFPNITDAQAYQSWVLSESEGANIPAYQTAGLDPSEVKRAVIVLPGKARDCWYYWNVMNNGLYVAVENYTTISRSEISIFAPCFFMEVDVQAGGATSDNLVFGETTWVSGHDNVGPSSVSNYSSYDVLDSIVSYYLDRSNYPNLNVVMLAGHSAGGQMVQRYMALRTSTKHDERLHFWIANPGTLMWLTEDRPLPNASCTGFDDYKYGMEAPFPRYGLHDFNTLGREGLTARYVARQAHYAWGLLDFSSSDTRCQANTTGLYHLQRGQNFYSVLQNLSTGVPANTTVDWIPDASHNDSQMMESPLGIEKLFLYNFNVTSDDAGTDSTTSTNGTSKSKSSSKHSGSVATQPAILSSGLLLLVTIMATLFC